MKLVLISGLTLARYMCGKQKEVVQLHSWTSDYDYASFIEHFRQHGIDDELQA